MNSEDCGMTAAEEYMYIAALIAAVSLFRIHCHMARTVLEISHSLSNQVSISFNLANFAWSLPAICLIRCCIPSIDVLLSGPVLVLEDGRRDGGLAMEKRERRDGGFGMEMMERRGSPAFQSLTGGPRAWWDPCVSVLMAGWATSGKHRPRREKVVFEWKRRGAALVLD